MKSVNGNILSWLLVLGLSWSGMGLASEHAGESQLQESRVFSVSAVDGMVNLGDLEYRLADTVFYDGKSISAKEALMLLSRHQDGVIWISEEQIDGQRFIQIIETSKR